jgi:transposase-like protein
MENEHGLPQTLADAIKCFADLDKCLLFLAELRWPDGVVKCPRCGSTEVRFLAKRRIWECKQRHDRRQFSIKTGTIMEDSPLGLDKWLAAIWMIANDKNGVSSYEVHRAIGVTQKTAWFMLHRIRLAMQTGTFAKFPGEVEVDETYIGGKARYMHKGRRKAKARGMVGKTAVMGLLERNGEVRTKVVPNARKKTLQAHVREHVEPGSAVYSDDLASCQGVSAEYDHQVVNHAVEYVRGNVHTNCMGNFWSLPKRAIKGTYVSCEPFHLFRYLDEEAFRYNQRKETDAERFLKVSAGLTGKRLTYKGLIGEPS